MSVSAAASRLPPLRSDLKLLPGPRAGDGSETWTLHDAVRHAFFRIGRHEFEVLARWTAGTPSAVAARVREETCLDVSTRDVEDILQFLKAHDLCLSDGSAHGQTLAEKARAARRSPLVWLLHHYLFIRIPLVRPDRFLDATLAYVAFAFTPLFRWITESALVLGLILLARQWDQFTHGFMYFFSWEGMGYYVVTLAIAKVLHELGHAYTVKRHGLSVPSMGVAFLVMFPVLYTDTSDAWRLTRRRPFLEIGAAGMAAELVLAAYATLAWGLLSDGPLRSAVLLLASTTWLMTLAVNLNPFMRFDGYFLFADAIGIENLQERAFRLARWWLREALFKFGDSCPEDVPAKKRYIMISYAFATWVYRFFLFLGIAVMVYYLFFKVLGIFLMGVELWWFVARPIFNELRAWWMRWDQARLNRNTIVTFGAFGVLVLALFVPWRAQVTAPALLAASQSVEVFTPVAGHVASSPVARTDQVAQGDLLVLLEWPELDYRAAQKQREIDILTWQLKRAQSLSEAQGEVAVLSQRLLEARAALTGVEQQKAQLQSLAPMSGRLVDKDPDLYPGRWLPKGHRLARILGNEGARVSAYIREEDVPRIRVGSSATFYPQGGGVEPVTLEIDAIAPSAVQKLRQPYLVSAFGGGLAARRLPNTSSKGAWEPEQSVYRVTLRAPRETVHSMMRGRVLIQAEAQSLAGRLFRHAAGVLVRESGF